MPLFCCEKGVIMRDINQITLTGRATATPEYRQATRQTTEAESETFSVCKFTLANGVSDKQTNFIKVSAFGKLADIVNNYVDKGTAMTVVGELRTGSYTNKDGQKIYTTEVVADQIILHSRKSDEGVASGADISAGGFAAFPDGTELPFN